MNRRRHAADASHGPISWKLRERWPELCIFGLGVLLALPSVPAALDFCVDDAWIHLVYARNLASGGGLSYNPGDWETGFSSPLWLTLLAFWPTFGNVLASVMALGTGLHGLAAGLVCALTRQLAQDWPRHTHAYLPLGTGLVAGTIFAAHPANIQAATSGMEVSLASVMLLACLLAHRNDRHKLAFWLGCAAYLTRPECLFPIATYAGLRWLWLRRLRTLIPLAGAITGLLAWSGYCLTISGYPWPNTQYVKGGGLHLEGLSYLVDRVLPEEPWLVGIGGPVLIVLALRSAPRERRAELLALTFAWSLSLLAIAVTRELRLGVLFHASRYFSILTAIPAVLLGLGALTVAKRWSLLALTPVALISGLMLAERYNTIGDQQRSVHLLHSKPAQYIAENLPKEATVAVEGAGALRWFTPPETTIIDALGLNDHELAHAENDVARACILVHRAPSHFVLPEHMSRPLSRVFELEPMANFLDDNYAQVSPRHPLSVGVFRVVGVTKRWRARCSRPGDETSVDAR